MRLAILIAVVQVLMPCWTRAADEPVRLDKRTPIVPPVVGRVTIVQQPGGVRALQIDYPWSVHQKPSVEVWLVTSDRSDKAQPKPSYFASRELKGETSVKFDKSVQNAYGVGGVDRVEQDGRKYDLIAYRNSQGRPSACVAWKSADEGSKKDKSEDKAAHIGSWAAFCELEDWAANRHRLFLDLPRDYFAKPGKLYIWFLRDDAILWEECLDWNGY